MPRMRTVSISGEVMHRTASSACGWYRLNRLIARLMPPLGGRLGRSPLTRGYRAQPTSSSVACDHEPSATLLFIADHTYGQLGMKPPFGPPNVARDSSSVEVDRAGSAALDVPSRRMIRAASRPASESMVTVASRPRSLF